MALRLRPARVTDLPSIYKGEEDYIRCWEPDHEAAWRAQFERHLSRWVENFELFTVAIMGEAFAGYSLWSPEQGCAQLCTIHVSESYRRSGIGLKLIDAYIQGAERQGVAHLTLSVRHDNPARLMYEQAGFVPAGTDANGDLRYERWAR